MTIDSHLHLWVNDPDNFPWHPIGGYVPEFNAPFSQFETTMEKNGIDGAVLVQPTPYGWDNTYLLQCKKVDPERFKAVVLVDPLSEASPLKLNQLIEQGADGLRINLHLEPLSNWKNQHFHNLLKQCVSLNCPVCLQLAPNYFPLLIELCQEYPINFVLDHLGRPDPGSSPQDEPFKQLLSFSKYPNVYVKLSGMNYYSNLSAPYIDTWPLIQAVKTSFGADHCLWGSDYPFVNEHWTYADNLDLLRQSLQFSDRDLTWILDKTARSLWWRADLH